MSRQLLTRLLVALLVAATWLGVMPAVYAVELPPATAPNAPAQPSVRDFVQQLETLKQQAFTATGQGDFVAAEGYWSQIIDRLPNNAAVWSNRGNVKVSQNKLTAALADYNKAIELAPAEPDSYLNRGAAFEGLSQWNAAIADYNRVLELAPQDPAAYNNRGNAEAGLGDWSAALADYKKSAELSSNYAIARANYALALYQTGEVETAIRNMRYLVRRYPNFADMRAALTAVLWQQGKQGEAESQWVSAVGLDSRYKDIDWVKTIRRWPPTMVSAMDKFLNLKSM